MRRIVYASFAHKHFAVPELFDLLVHARAANARRDITGTLFYQDRFFLQCLEGPSVEVSAVLDKIARDPRHGGFTILSDQAIVASRLFSSWAMGFFHMDAIEALAPEGMLSNGTDFESALANGESADPAEVIMRQYWAANARKLTRQRVTPSRAPVPNG